MIISVITGILTDIILISSVYFVWTRKEYYKRKLKECSDS